MFSAYCEHCGTVVLLGPANVCSIHNTSDGIVLYFRCHLGHSGVWRPGRRLPGQTNGAPGAALGNGAAGRGAASPRAVPGGLPRDRHSW